MDIVDCDMDYIRFAILGRIFQMITIVIEDVKEIQVDTTSQETKIDFIDTHGGTYRVEMSRADAAYLMNQLYSTLNKIARG